jgi:hypothetical protein
MVLGTYTGETVDNNGIRGSYTTLETMDTDGRLAPLLALPQYARVTALAGVGHEILAVVVRSPPYRRELWRIAATHGTATEKIELPLPPPGLPINVVTSIDLASDGCTLAYAVPGEVVHRFDLCARRPLQDAPTRPVSAIHFLPQGNLLVSESIGPTVRRLSRLARYDREGRLVSAADLALQTDESITAMAVDPDGSTAWIATSRGYAESCPVAGRVMAVNASSGAFIAGPWQFGGGGILVGIAVAGEWRAAEQPARGRAVR